MNHTMNEFLKTDPWKLIEERFDARRVEASESLFALGNGVMGGRANFEEHYSGPSLQGNYIGGVYYPDKTRVGWWKNGYPEYFAKVLNAAFWIGVDVAIDGERLDLARVEVLDFYREMDMRRSVLTRRMRVRMAGGAEVAVEVQRFLSLERRELGVIRYAVTPLDRAARIVFTPYIDADVRNADANYDEKFWEEVATDGDAVQSRTRKSGFEAAWAQVVTLDGAEFRCTTEPEKVRHTAEVRCEKGRTAVLYKYAGICSSLNHAPGELIAAARAAAADGAAAGFDALLREQEEAWARRWHGCDIVIEGDDEAQQGIRFCIFMLLQTYTGVDTRLNIGPKGFTGEKYGGVTYWDTEAYCLPFYLATAGAEVARELLVYRYDQLDKAIENAAKLGFRDGAALYPMVTINGEECHNEWEITFEEIHRNGAIAYAVFNYVRYTGDEGYLADCGLEVLLSIARFWAQRITWSEARGQYVMLGVTGPNEYENNVNNNWYTSYIACWCLRYAAEAAAWVRANRPADYARICAKRAFDEAAETARWGSSSSRTAIWTRSRCSLPTSIPPSVRSIRSGRGTASCVRASSSRPTCCRASISSRRISTWRPSGATSASTRPARSTSRAFRPACMPSSPRRSATWRKPTNSICARRASIWTTTTARSGRGATSLRWPGRGSRWSRASAACA